MIHRWITVLICATALAVFVPPARAQSPARETPLLSVAHKVAALVNVSDDTYFWVSDHQVLLFRVVHNAYSHEEKRLLAPMIADAAEDFAPGHFQPVVFDTYSMKMSPLEPFYSKYPNALPAAPSGASIAGEPNSGWTVYIMLVPCSLSIDGKWLLWMHLRGTEGLWTASRLDGSREATWPPSGSEPVWAPDNRHWVEIRESGSAAGYDLAVVHDLQTPSLSRKVKINPSEGGIVQGMTSDGSLVLSDFDDDHPDQPIKINVYVLGGASAKMRAYTITPPTELRGASEVALSPAGDRLAWVFDNNYETLGTSQVGTYLLCTSDLDGSHMHIIGSMQGYLAPKMVDHRLYYWPETLRWTPDGKHISFIFRDALYVVQAP